MVFSKSHPLVWMACLLVALAACVLRPAPAFAQPAPDPDAPYLSEVAPVAGVGQPAWVELTIGRVEPGSVDTPSASGASRIYLPVIQTSGTAVAAVAASPDAAGTAALANWRLDDGDGNSYALPAGLGTVPKGTVVLVLFDGQGPAGDDLDPADGVVTLHTPPSLTDIFDAAGDQLALYDAANVVVDFVAWGQSAGEDDDAAVAAALWQPDAFVAYDEGFGAGGQPSPTTPGQSLGIWQDAPDQDAKNWVPYSAAHSTPGKVNPPPAPLNSTVPDGAAVGVNLQPVTAAGAGPHVNPALSLAWSAMGDKFQYEFQLDDNADFGSPMADEVRSVASWTGQLGEGDYYWRTRIKDARGKYSAYFGPFKVTIVDLGKYFTLGTVKTLLDPSEYKMQRKDSTMLDIGGGPNNVVGANNAGNRRYPKDRRWDGPHVNQNDVASFGWNGMDNWYCVRASTSMINDYYGGNLSQDRISYYTFEELAAANNATKGIPEHDLGFGSGIGNYGTQETVLSWALGGVGVTPILYCPPNPNDGNAYNCPNPNGAPMTFADIKGFVDAGRPFMSINLRNAHARVVDGYWEISANNRWVHMIDPVPADTGVCNTCTNAQWIEYTTFTNRHERTIVGPANVPNPRQDETTLKLDSDGDGIGDFDEIGRFDTDPTKADSDGDWVLDKNDMAEYIFDVSAVGVYVYTPGMAPKTSDFDGDGKRKEVDPDNDNDGVPDGCEDANQDGEFDGAGAGETNNFNANSQQICQPRFAIVKPVTGQAANAGDPNNPDKVLIRLSVALPPALANKPTFNLNQFSATIGGKPAPVINGAQVGQEFWLLVQAPTQDSNSFFDLAVSFAGAATGHNDQSDTETTAVYYIPRPRMDTMVVLDTSGSMLDGNKLDSAKNAARLYVDQWTVDDRVGVVTFDDTATVDLPLSTVLANTQVLADAKAAINATVANGATAMGPGLLAGQQQLQANGAGDHDWSMMLLTDGQENVPPYWNDGAVSGVIVPSKTVVNTIGLGEPTAIWFGLLQQIAGATGGVFGAVNDPSVLMAAGADSVAGVDAISAFPGQTANQLADAYKYAAEQILGEQRLYEETGTVASTSPCAVHRFTVGELPSLAVTGNWAVPGQARLDVYRPSGIQVDKADAGVEYRSDPTHEQYRVSSAQGSLAGLWRVEICPVVGPLGGDATEYVVFAAADSSLTLNLVVGDPVQRPNVAGAPVADVQVLAFLADTQPVLVPSVQLDVRLPSGQASMPIALLDDGQHGDGAPGDGIYGGSLMIVQRGAYLLKATATVGSAAYRYAQATLNY